MDFVVQADGENLSCTSFSPANTINAERRRVVVMHGAGNGNKERTAPLARDFAVAGFPAVAFDFSGHGKSSGALSDLSLERRFRQAAQIIKAFAGDKEPLILVGFSMSGQTIADLVDHFGNRIQGICLCAPAAYAPEAWTVPFGPSFTDIVRQRENWKSSRVFEIYRNFAGRAVLIIPEHDQVIPPGVTVAIETALREKSQFTKVIVEGADHQLGRWLVDKPNWRAKIVQLCVSAGIIESQPTEEYSA